MFHVIDSRYRSKKPMIVTTNLTLDELKHPADVAHARIYDRVLERCVPLKLNNRNLRAENAEANLRRLRERMAP
jgi:DNA replication protein DnaC